MNISGSQRSPGQLHLIVKHGEISPCFLSRIYCRYIVYVCVWIWMFYGCLVINWLFPLFMNILILLCL